MCFASWLDKTATAKYGYEVEREHELGPRKVRRFIRRPTGGARNHAVQGERADADVKRAAQSPKRIDAAIAQQRATCEQDYQVESQKRRFDIARAINQPRDRKQIKRQLNVG